MNEIITFEKNFFGDHVFFFSTSHSQKIFDKEFIPITHYNTTREEIKTLIENHKGREIKNPDPKYQA